MNVLSKEQVLRLNQLGIDTSGMGINVNTTKTIHDADSGCVIGKSVKTEFIEAVTLEDVLNLLPQRIVVNKVGYLLIFDVCICRLKYAIHDVELTSVYAKNMLYAAYSLLVWVLENGYLKTK